MKSRWTEGPGGHEFGSFSAEKPLPILAPPNTNPQITAIWAFVSVDEGGEGIIAMLRDGEWFPLVTSEEQTLPAMRKWARQVVMGTVKRVRLIKLTTREVVEEFGRDI